MREDFDPLTMVPQDDTEALMALKRSGELLTATLHGLYHAHRGQGHDVLGAFKKTLLTHADSFKAGE